jgi:hypothetical protein
MSQGAIRKVELPSLFIICNRYSTEIANQSTQMNKQRAILSQTLTAVTSTAVSKHAQALQSYQEIIEIKL